MVPAKVLPRHSVGLAFGFLFCVRNGAPDTFRGLRRQARAAFGSSLLDDPAARFRCHARPETVRSGPFNLAWLEGAFHLPAT